MRGQYWTPIDKERFRNLVESTNVIPWEVDLSTWRFTYVDLHAERLTGYPGRRLVWRELPGWVQPVWKRLRDCLCDSSVGFGDLPRWDFQFWKYAPAGEGFWAGFCGCRCGDLAG